MTGDHNMPVFEVGFNHLKVTLSRPHTLHRSQDMFNPKPLRENRPAEGLGSQKTQHLRKHLTSGRGK